MLLHVVDPDQFPYERDLHFGARVNRQRRASAYVIYNISNNLQQERKWTTTNQYRRSAASGQTFGHSRAGSVPAWIPDHAAAQPPARHGPFFQHLEPLKRRLIKWLAHLAQREETQAPTIAEWWPLLRATEID
eukprot:6465663-Pyramimonas_sp.AAC.1